MAMMMTTIAEAAAARSQGYRQRGDRPSQRRAPGAEFSGLAHVAARAQVQMREAGESGLLAFEGYASVYEAPYEMWDMWGPYTEVVSTGAASDLARADLDVPLVLAHDQLRRIARTTNGTLELSQDERGLRALAPSLDPADVDVAYIAPKLRAGLIDEMSFAFRIELGMWSPDYTEYRIERFTIHRGDVAIVGFGANPSTAGSGLREAPAVEPERRRRALDEFMRL